MLLALSDPVIAYLAGKLLSRRHSIAAFAKPDWREFDNEISPRTSKPLQKQNRRNELQSPCSQAHWLQNVFLFWTEANQAKAIVLCSSDNTLPSRSSILAQEHQRPIYAGAVSSTRTSGYVPARWSLFVCILRIQRTMQELYASSCTPRGHWFKL